GKRLVGQFGKVLLGIVSERPAADGVECVELADRLELVAKIAQHEADESFGLTALFAGFVPRLDRADGQASRNQHPDKRAGGEDREPVLSADRVAADEIVQPDSEHSGNELEKTKSPRVSSASKIGRQGLGALGGGTTSP